MSYTIFYKLNGGALRTTTAKSIDSLPFFNDGKITSGTSEYYTGGFSNGSSGYYPNADFTNRDGLSGIYNAVEVAVTHDSGASSIYAANVQSDFNSILGAFGAIDIDLSTTPTLEFCTNKGENLGLTMNFRYTNTELPCGIRINWTQTDYTGNCYISISPGYTQSNIVNKIAFFLLSDNALGVAIYHTSTGTWYGGSNAAYNPVYTAYCYPYFDDGSSLIYRYLNYYNALYGASGSSDDDSESSGDSDSGYGDYDFSNDDIDPGDDMPSSSPAIAAGLVNPYYVTSSEIASLGNFLWSDSFFDSIAKTFSNPMDCVISLASFPVSSSLMSLGSSESVRVGNTTSSSTGTRLISEFVTIDCGSVSVPETWGSYLDYAQTKLYIYIPYLGIEELPLCECMGGSVACELRVNLLTGALVACVTLTSGSYVTGSARKQPIYFSTTCKSDIPVSGATTGALAGAFQLLGGATSAIAGVATGVAPLAISGLASAAQGVATMQSQNSQISGAVGAAGGQMAHKIPFLIFDRPVQSVPANLSKVAGYQSNSGTTLSSCSGYVICDTINLDGLALTRSELEEVEQICTSGVYIS